MSTQPLAQQFEPINTAPIGANFLDTKRGRFDNGHQVAQATVPKIIDNNSVEILTAEQLAQKLQVKTSWVVTHCSKARTRDPLPVLKIGKHRRFRWNSKEMNAWLDRRAGISTKRAAGQ